MKRVNTRITEEQDNFIKEEARVSSGRLTEGDVFRALLDEAINNRNSI